MTRSTIGHARAKRLRGPLVVLVAGALAAAALPGTVAAERALERIVLRHHQLEFSEYVTDDACGEVAGGQGLRSGTFYMTETGHTTIWVYPDRFHLVDVETGTYTYDFDDPTIPDVEGARYSSPVNFVLTKSGNENYVENQVEFVPGSPDGLRIRIGISLHWRDGVPHVEREFFQVTGCP